MCFIVYTGIEQAIQCTSSSNALWRRECRTEACRSSVSVGKGPEVAPSDCEESVGCDYGEKEIRRNNRLFLLWPKTWKRKRCRVIRVGVTIVWWPHCLSIVDQCARHWLDRSWGTPTGHGARHGPTHDWPRYASRVLSMEKVCPMEWIMVDSMGSWCAPLYTSRHWRDPRSGASCTMEHAMVYSMLVPDDASVEISSSGEPIKQTITWFMPWSLMARSTGNAMDLPMVDPMVKPVLPWNLPWNEIVHMGYAMVDLRGTPHGRFHGHYQVVCPRLPPDTCHG